MRFSIATILLVLVCCALLFAWYSERTRFTEAEAKWQQERLNLMQASIMLGERRARIFLNDEDLNEMFTANNKLTEHYAAQNLVIMANIKKEWQKALCFHEAHYSPTQFNHQFFEYWCIAGNPTFVQLEKRYTAPEFTIKRPKELQDMIKWCQEKIRH